jgi:hypothetical protein
MKRTVLLIGVIIIALFGCDKEKNDNPNLVISTDKLIYTSKEEVKINITNNYESVLSYYICSSYNGIPPSILKYENDDWTGYWGPICDGFFSHCCGEFEPNSEYDDTFNINFEKGTYKIEYSFIIEHGEGYQSFYSNEFKFE